MQVISRWVFLFCLAWLSCADIAHAQQITVTPKDSSIGVGTTVQFNAAVTGLSNSTVIWSAGGVVGGNDIVGKISSSGLYTAPTVVPGQNPLLIKATSTANSSISGSVFVYILSNGPTITAVSPNPLKVGMFTVTITGTGFLPYATVIDQSWGLPIQLTTTSVTPTTITAVGYQDVAQTASFWVRNPGSTKSNTITIPVVSADSAKYVLTVVNGSGSGTYTAGTLVTITANTPPSGQTFVKWTGTAVANPSAATTTLTMPASNVSVTANYSGGTVNNYQLNVVNGSRSGTYTAGTIVTITANAAPFGQQFANWTGATVQNANASTTTLTMPAANTTVTANYVAVAVTIPYPVTTHPRLWITQADLPRLQSWAVASNPIYAQGIAPLLAQAVAAYNTYFFPGGVPANPYPDIGDIQGYGICGGTYVSANTEVVAAVLAFGSLIDPNASNRIRDAQYARNLLMYAMNQAALGHLANAPFRDPAFMDYNRCNGSGEDWALAVDWIYNAKDDKGAPILSAADKQTIRKVFMIWANDCLNANAGGGHPSPIGVLNSPRLLVNRMAMNNYFLGHARVLTMMALCMDPSDDPLVNQNLPASQIGNTLRSYILDATGAWLYQLYAMMGDPTTVAADYGLSNNAGLGLSSGGLPPEGFLYGASYSYLLGGLLALQTAGFNNVAYSGPQSHLIGAPVWDRFITGYISSMTPSAKVFASEPWIGPVYQYGSYGDILRLWVTPNYMQPFALIDLIDKQNGRSDHDKAVLWFVVNAVEGGPAALLKRVSNPWSYGAESALLYYMLMDPAAQPASDPRPSYPTVFFDPADGRVVAHSDWSANGTMFDYRASWLSIYHQQADGGQFELYRNGEWLTKEMSNYDNNNLGQTSMFHNTLSLQNWCANGTPNLNWFENYEWVDGSEWILGLSAGDPATVTSSGSGYVYAASDLTNLYNRPNYWTPANSAADIIQATRSVIWLANDYVVVYDRATSIHSNLFKRFNLCLTTNPSIFGNTSTETLPSGQQLYIQTLLPQSPSISATRAGDNLTLIADLEPTRYVLAVEDPTRPADMRFLHVLQGANAGAAMVPAMRIQSTGGAAFDGAVFGSYAVFFPVNRIAVAGTSVSVPTGVHTLLITGLAAKAPFVVSIAANSTGGSTISVSAGNGGYTSDSAGVLRITF